MLRADSVARTRPVSTPRAPLALTKLRTLDTDAPTQPGRPAFVSSGSGLLVLGQKAYVVPDDENFVAVFDLKKKGPGQWLRVAPGDLPVEVHARKGVKNDFESITALPAFAGHPHGAVMLMPSGSGPIRHKASLVPLNADGTLQTVSGRARYQTVDFGKLYAKLGAKSPDLNIEGSVLLHPKGSEPILRLVTRGEQGAGKNGFADVSWPKALKAIEAGEPIPASALLSVRQFELGKREGVRLGLSDVAPLPDGRMVFTAVAEDTKDPVHDGKFVGAAIGVVSADGKVQRVVKVDGYKIEGIHATLEKDGAIKLLLVDDPDDPAVKSTLLSARLPPA